jgi:16S rRNA (guanine527-N7)-methyltransferase
LQEVININNIKNIELLHGRAEDYGKDLNYREKYNISVARAVANTATLSELCLPFVKIGGIFICMKGNQTEEVKVGEKAIEIMGGKLEEVENIILPGTDIERNIFIVRKVKETPSKYPRKAGTPEKDPIL